MCRCLGAAAEQQKIERGAERIEILRGSAVATASGHGHAAFDGLVGDGLQRGRRRADAFAERHGAMRGVAPEEIGRPDGAMGEADGEDSRSEATIGGRT